jgi:hypothetical protein
MKHVMGMAKRHLDLRGAKGPKLELDFLRLTVAVAELKRRGHDAKGYLLVMTPAIADRARAWAAKYPSGDGVEILVADVSPYELVMLNAEVQANTAGMIGGAQGQSVAGLSDASAGASVAEAKLRSIIEVREPGVREVRDSSRFPLGVRWDYYGVVAAP